MITIYLISDLVKRKILYDVFSVEYHMFLCFSAPCNLKIQHIVKINNILK